MKRTKKRRGRTGKVKFPAWFTRLCKTLIARERSAFLPGGKHETLKHAGAIMGHMFCDLDQFHKDDSKAQPTAQAREDLAKRRAWLGVNVGKAAAYMSKTDATEFFSGFLSELKRRSPCRGYGYAAVAEHLFLNHIGAVTRCDTQREVADLVKSHLPPEQRARLAEDRHTALSPTASEEDRHAEVSRKAMAEAQRIAFYKAVRMFCNRIGFTPAKRGRPPKK
jgi:uncharacterized protein YchJ